MPFLFSDWDTCHFTSLFILCQTVSFVDFFLVFTLENMGNINWLVWLNRWLDLAMGVGWSHLLQEGKKNNGAVSFYIPLITKE